MGLNARQKEAVEYLDGPLLVLAGPGTGKTQLLSEKVAYILKNTDTNPENILCLTFTESGASNMRERLKSIIGASARKVNIGTYHSFGSDILSIYKDYSENYDRNLDASIDEVLQFKIIKGIQDKLPGTDILRGDNVKNIIEVISEARSAGLSADDLEKVAKINLEDSRVLSEAISPLLKNVVPRNFSASLSGAYRPIYELLKNYENATPILPTVERSIAKLARDLRDAIVEAESNQKIVPLTGWRNNYFEKDSQGNYRLKDRIANKKLLSVSNVMQKYIAYLKEHALFDFDDMVQEAVRVLSEDIGFRLTLQEKYQYIMLDEFQDTNPSQLAIVKALTDYEKPMIMAVGDDDQAIFEFQGAMATNLSDFQEHYNAHVIALAENYRSTQEILDFSHEIIKQAPDRFADKELFAHKENPEKSQICRKEFLSSDAEFGFVAEKISALVKSGVKQSDIAVISYKTKYFLPLLNYLKREKDVKIAYEKRDNLFEDLRIYQMLRVLRYANEIASGVRPSVSLVEIMGYDFFKVPMVSVVKEIHAARDGHKPSYEALADSENQDIRDNVEFLTELATKSFTEPLEVIFALMIEEMGVKNYPEYEQFRFYENLSALKGTLTKHFGGKALKLADLIEMVDDYEAASMPLTVKSPYRDAEDAVQILSAHKAKGLEFKYVFIISADHTAWGAGKGNNNLLSLPKNLEQIRHTGMTDGERLRILYVALTRAKDTLYITNSLTDFNGKSADRLEYLNEYAEKTSDGTEVVVSPFLPSSEVELDYDSAGENLSSMIENVKNWIVPYVNSSPDMRVLYRERAEKLWLSASSLTDFIDIVYAGPQEFFKRYILCVPTEAETESLAFGTLVHKTYEMITNKHLSNDEAIEFYLEELSKHELPSDVMTKLREKGPADLAISLEKFGDILRQGEAEINLGRERILIDGVPVTGKVDHIIIHEDTKTIEIYDYKTGGYHSEAWSKHATLYKYMLQLGFYKLLLNRSQKYSKYKVEKAHILFVIPDKDGEVYDKEYIFTDEDEKELTALIKATYELVSTLRFMDDPELFIEADNTLGIKDIMEFKELVLEKSASI